MVISSKRAEYVAWAALVFNIIFCLLTFLLAKWSFYFAIYSVAWLTLSAVFIWFVLVLQFHQRSLAEQEKLDLSQLEKQDAASTIFQTKQSHPDLFATAQKRLRLFEKWFLPIFSVLIAVFQLAVGLYLLRLANIVDYVGTKQPLICAAAMIVIAFLSFLMSRFATGMSTQFEWKPLRAGGSITLLVAVLCFAVGAALTFANYKSFQFLNILNYVTPVLLIVLGVETLLNVVLDIYRPRLKGQYSRSPFDSRLLGIINEPGSLFKSAATAIDYQFGFKVSQTWFYKLLEKAVLPLVLFGAVTLYLLTCVVILGPDEQAIVEHFGNPFNSDGTVRLINPGLTLKYPWPVDIAYKYPSNRIMELSIGFVPKYKPGTDEPDREPLLWNKKHYSEEYQILVATRSSDISQGAAPVSLINAAVPVQYRVKNLYDFLYNHNNSQQLLEAICYRELTQLAANSQIEVDNQADSSSSLLGAGRAASKELLTKRIQAEADKQKLGVEIVFVGLQGIHPPVDVANAYEAVVGAVQIKHAAILHAEADKNESLGNLAGSVEKADRLSELAVQYRQATNENDQAKIDKITDEIDQEFAQSKGQIFETLQKAQSYSFNKASAAQAVGLRFADQLKAYQASPEIYKNMQRLTVFEQGLGKIRKYIVVSDANDSQVFIVDVQEKIEPGLYDIAGIEGKK